MLGVVLGSANCLDEDLAKLDAIYTGPRIVVAVNDAGWYYRGKLDHWATLHPEYFHKIAGSQNGNWLEKRRIAGGDMTFQTWSRRAPELVDEIVDHWGGSSGMLGVRLHFHLGVWPIVVCGVPMDKRPKFDKPGAWNGGTEFPKDWERLKPDLAGRVRSFSGYTRELLGKPTLAWILSGGRQLT
jgi:hypothetical protein